MSDLLERLRNPKSELTAAGDVRFASEVLYTSALDAADRIEALQAENDRLTDAIKNVLPALDLDECKWIERTGDTILDEWRRSCIDEAEKELRAALKPENGG